jgi:sulfatase maturation enzyme AslB (radical SAM superfamily)
LEICEKGCKIASNSARQAILIAPCAWYLTCARNRLCRILNTCRIIRATRQRTRARLLCRILNTCRITCAWYLTCARNHCVGCQGEVFKCPRVHARVQEIIALVVRRF